MRSTCAAILLGAVCQIACSSSSQSVHPTSTDGAGNSNSMDVAGSGAALDAASGAAQDNQSAVVTAGTGGASGGAEGSVDAGGASDVGGAAGQIGGGGDDGGGGADAPEAADRGSDRAAMQAVDSAASDVTSTKPEGGTGDGASSDAAAWPTVSDYAAPGAFTVMRETNIGPGAAYDLFRPSELSTDHRMHPIISWANGTLFSVDDYAPLLSHWASHGFVVIANHTNTTAGGATHKAGIDWLVAQNATSTSPYFGTLDVKLIGAAGHSQGGGATLAAGANKPGTTGITTTLPLMPLLSFEADKTIVAHQLVPMFNINASMDNRDPTGMYANQIYDGAITELVQASFIGVHEDAMGAKMHGPTGAWFRFKLMGDAQAKAVFYPMATCGLCQDADWKLVRYKNPAP